MRRSCVLNITNIAVVAACCFLSVGAASVCVAQASGVAGPWTDTQRKPPLSDRVERVLANNPLSNAWSAVKGRSKQKSYGRTPPRSYEHDPISLQHPTGPPTPGLFVATAQLCERQGQIEQARHHYGRAMAIDPKNVEALLGAGRMEDRLGQMDVAEQLYRRALAANPSHTRSLNDLALCLARQGKLRESVQLLEKAIEIQSDKALYRNNIATVLVELQRDREALAQLTAVHGPAVANYNLGNLLTKRGRTNEASAYFLAATEIDPQLGHAQAALAAVDAGRPGRSPVGTGAPPPMGNPPPHGPQLARPAVRPPNDPASAQRPPAPGYQRQAMRPGAAGAAPPMWNSQPMPVRHLPPVGPTPTR